MPALLHSSMICCALSYYQTVQELTKQLAAAHAFIEERIRDLMDNYTIICNGGMTEWH